MYVVKKLSSHGFCALLFALGVNSVTVYQGLSNIQLTHNIEPVKDQCWHSAGDGGPHIYLDSCISQIHLFISHWDK